MIRRDEKHEQAGGKRKGTVFFAAAAVCVVLAACLRFLFIGYRFSAICLCCAAAVLVFYGMLRRRRSKTAGILCAIVSAVLAAGFMLFLAAEIPVWTHAGSDEQTDAPYLIVFGAAVHGSTPSLSMRERLDAALGWIEAHPEGKVVVSGGQGANEELSEAEAMSRWLVDHGVARERILLEDDSTSSYENLLFSMRVIEDDGGDPSGPVALCSSEYHLYRLRMLGETFGCEPVMIAAKTGHITLRINYAVREAFAVWRIWLLGPG